jgi:ribosomal protein L37AE/L43A
VAEPGPVRAWSFLVVEEGDRQHRGNEGYDDEPDRHYSWDSTVPNREGPSVGDVCLVRDSRGALGVSQIDHVRHADGAEKLRLRCPFCTSTALKGRTATQPTYRCSHCKEEFDDPVEEQIEITRYRADYARSWIPIDGAVTATELEANCYLSRSKQQAIRPVDPDALRALVTSRQILIGTEWWKRGVQIDAPEIRGGRQPRTVMGRVGQSEFRRRLLERFGPVCAFTGPQPLDSLQASHVTPYSKDPRHVVAGGLLLRSDLHTLFDNGLITIDEDLRVRIDSSLRRYRELARLDGSPLKIDLNDSMLPTLRKLLKERSRRRD